MKDLRSVLVQELGKHLGDYAARTIIAKQMVKKKILDLNNVSHGYRIRFLDELIEDSLSRFVTPERLKNIKESFFKLIADDIDRGRPILPKWDLFENDVINDPMDFMREKFGISISEMLIARELHGRSLSNLSMPERILLVRKAMDAIISRFYDDESGPNIVAQYVLYLKGFKESDAPMRALVIDMDPEDMKIESSNVDGALLEYLSYIVGPERSQRLLDSAKKKLSIRFLQDSAIEKRALTLEYLIEGISRFTSQAKAIVLRSHMADILKLSGHE